MNKLLSALGIILLFVLGTHLVLSQNAMTFFITSSGPGNGANLGGLAGADKHCQSLAAAAGAGNRTWHAYLSTTASGGQAAVNARDRIGQGPWYNAKGVRIAENVADLHGDNNNLTKQTPLTEKGEMVNGRGDQPNRHDILTGSQLDGTALARRPRQRQPAGTGPVAVRAVRCWAIMIVRAAATNPTSWNSAHPSRGCSQENLRGTGGDGFFYCFATN